MKIPFKMHKGYDPLGACGKGKCPICARNNALFNVKEQMDKVEFSSDAVAPFVGRFGYPHVNVGILAPPEYEQESWMFDAPKYWSYKQFEIPKIVGFRSSLVNSRYTINIKSRPKLLSLSQELGMSSKPVDIDISLNKKPSFRMNLDSYMAPTGPAAKLKKVRMTSNPKIHTKVQKVYDDIDWKAQDAMTYLYENKFDENFLTRILSVGTLGMKKNRKLVPTRWSITATDDTLGKYLTETIRDFPETNHAAFFGGYLGNYYLILLFPEVWGYELFETYVSSNQTMTKSLRHTTDHETFEGRKNYASNTAGGYYTVRLGILEYLKKARRQATCIALRFITDEYTMPLGVWVTREATRNAMENKVEFSSQELMLSYARKLVKKKFNANADFLLKKSKLLTTLRNQRKLMDFAS